MSKLIRTVLVTGIAAAALAVPTTAQAANPCANYKESWGGFVQCVNFEEREYGTGYGEDDEGNEYENRGDFVRDQAQDDDGRGYGQEIQDDARIGHNR
jgi:hypothetical protein